MKSYSIDSREHLRLQNEITHILRRGKKVENQLLKLSFLQNHKEHCRFAVIINKKFGKAVLRNKAKRQIRELYRTQKKLCQPGYDMVFYIKYDFKSPAFKEKKMLFLDMLQKAGIYKK